MKSETSAVDESRESPSTIPTIAPGNEVERQLQSRDSQPTLAEAKPMIEADEDALVRRIRELWSTHAVRNSEVRQTREQMRALRLDLGKDLSRYKKLLARSGRGGKRASFLHEQRISRATADRYVQIWEATQDPEGKNRLSESIAALTPDQIASLVRTVLKRLITPDSRKQFMDALALALGQSAPSSV
jgi:hypothetical protein